MKRRPAIFLALLLTACQMGMPNAGAQNDPGAQSDIVAQNLGISLGHGWYRTETAAGKTFRWVSNDAALSVKAPSKQVVKVSLEVEAGPGLGTIKFPLQLRDAAGHTLAVVPIDGHQRVRLDLPVERAASATFMLHVDGGGKKAPKDPRILNFRVFSIADASGDPNLAPGHPDIALTSNIRLGSNWYPLEQYKGETFRWVDNDAHFTVQADAPGRRGLTIVAASGPAIKSPGDFTIALRDAGGKQIASARVRARGRAYFPILLTRGDNEFTIHVDSTNKRVASDPRTLNLRIFSIALGS